MQSGNTAACARSGLTMLTDALTRFVSSAHRDVAALREALKRATAWLQDAHQQLAERSAAVERALQLARDRIAAAEQSAEHERTAARDRFSVLETALTGTLTEGKAHADGAAGDLRRRLRAARWQWCRSGDLDALQRAVEVAAQAYSESMSSAAASAQRGIDVATEQHATPFTAPAQPPLQLDIGDVSSEGRARRALYGHAQLLRRALWQSWYLPGLRHFERDVLPREAQSHAAWLTAAADAARAAGRATLDARLADIARRVAASIADIKTQAQYTELEAEHNALAAHLPVLQAESAAVAQLQAHAAQLR